MDLFSLAWSIGWFVTVAVSAALTFAHKDQFEQAPNDLPWGVLIIPGVVLLVGLWPAVLAIEIGWFIWPFVHNLVVARNTLSNP